MNTASATVLGDLAPTGTLRASINFGNVVLAMGTSQQPSGITPDLAHELGRRLGVPVALSCFDAAGKAFEALKAGVVDVVFLAIEPVRAAEIEFTAPYVIIEGAYLVTADSSLQTPADVDQTGNRIGVNEASAYDLFLTRSLNSAGLVRGASGIELFLDQGLDAAAGVRQALEQYADGRAGFRLLPEGFMEIRQAMGTAKGRHAGAGYLRDFIEELKAEGFIAESLQRSGQAGVTIAPPAG